jgi:hypothetical protein
VRAFLIAAAALVTVTVVDLKTGATFPRRHADREYKELFIAMGLALAALGAASWIRMKKKAASVLDGAVPGIGGIEFLLAARRS